MNNGNKQNKTIVSKYISKSEVKKTVLVGTATWIVVLFLISISLHHFSQKVPENASFEGNGLTDRNLTLKPNQRWDTHIYIFVGGAHQSGTTVTERLLSSQLQASGLQINERKVPSTESCVFVDSSLTACMRY